MTIFFLPSLLLYFLPFQPDATDIVKKADEKMRGNTMQADLVIQTIRPTWSREMSCRVWQKGHQLAMILIQSPAKDKGIGFLKKRREVWNWMPALERTIRLPPSMMSQSWMGTDFTNDDLVKESSVVEDYTHHLAGDTVIQGRSSYIIEMIPKPSAAIVWSRVIVCIDKKDYLELHSRFYDEDGKLTQEMNSYDIRLMHDRVIPTRFEMVPTDKKGQRTVMIYRSVVFNKPIEDGFFSVEKLKTLQ